MIDCKEWYESYERPVEIFKKSEFSECQLTKVEFVYSGEDDGVLCFFVKFKDLIVRR